MLNIFLQAARGILNSFICVVHFSNLFNSIFHEKFWWKLLALEQYSMLRKSDWILRTFTFNDKNLLYLWKLWQFRILLGSKQSTSNLIRHKTIWHIPNIKNSEFKLKKCHVFLNPLLLFFSFIFLDNTSYKFLDQSPSSHYQCCFQVSDTVFW